MRVAITARSLRAGELNNSFVGETLSYEDSDGAELHFKVAHIKWQTHLVEITLDGVIVDGSSVVLQLRHAEEVWHEPHE